MMLPMKARSIALALGLIGCSGPSQPAAPAPLVANILPGLISSERLAGMLSARGLTILDVRTEWTDYLQDHLPNAAWLNTETLRATEDGLPFQLLPPETYAMLFTRLGVRADRPVVIYSAGESKDIDATFVAWILAGLHQPEVYVLDGGYAKWALEGRALARHYAAPLPGRFASRPLSVEGASLDEVRRAVQHHDVLLVDARNPQQYAGSAGAQMRRGHIPGAINHPWQSDLEKRDLALVWKSVADLRGSYIAQGITPNRAIIVYCNTGTEASHVHFALRYLLGYPDVKIYVGAWSQWAEREELRIEQ